MHSRFTLTEEQEINSLLNLKHNQRQIHIVDSTKFNKWTETFQPLLYDQQWLIWLSFKKRRERS